MKTIKVGVSILVLTLSALGAQNPVTRRGQATPQTAIEKGARWLASVQGPDGGWGQDGGHTSYVRTGERLETSGNDVANTAVAALALRRAGREYQANVERALEFILQRVEASPAQGLAVTDVQGTQIQRKLGPYIDTFLAAMLLAEVDGTLGKPALNARVRRGLEKSVAKIEQNQLNDGSWNVAGGWAPVLGTSIASRSLFEAEMKGVRVQDKVLKKAEAYTLQTLNAAPPPATAAGTVRIPAGAASASAGVALYQSAQALEQLSRTDADRRRNEKEIATIQRQMQDASFVAGFGSMGGEEFFSYLNLSDGMKRAGGPAWRQWHSDITRKIVDLQNNDGTWAGHHCITGRVAVTSAAILNLTVDESD
jgi:hypothetical protein